MTIFTMPDSIYRLSSLRMNLAFANTSSGPSNFNPLTFVDGPSATYWTVAITINPQDDEEIIDTIDRFLRKQRGGRHLARIYDYGRLAPRGAGGLGPVVNAAADAPSGSDTITLMNLKPSEAIVFRAGDKLGIGENLHVVDDDASSDATGQAAVVIQPPLRRGLAEGDAVNTAKPTGLFRITSGAEDFTIGPPYMSGPLSLTFAEVPDFEG